MIDNETIQLTIDILKFHYKKVEDCETDEDYMNNGIVSKDIFRSTFEVEEHLNRINEMIDFLRDNRFFQLKKLKDDL